MNFRGNCENAVLSRHRGGDVRVQHDVPSWPRVMRVDREEVQARY